MSRIFWLGLITVIASANLCLAQSSDSSSKKKYWPPNIEKKDLGLKQYNDLGDDDWTVGAEFHLKAGGGNRELPKEKWLDLGSHTLVCGSGFRYSVEAQGSIAFDRNINQDPLEGRIFIGFGFNPDLEPKDLDNSSPVEFDLGRWELGLQAGYETDQALDHQDITAGIDLVWAHNNHAISPWLVFLPSIHAGLDRVDTQKSKKRDEIGVDDHKTYWRPRVNANWKMGQWPDLTGQSIKSECSSGWPETLRRIGFQFDLSWSKEFDAEDAWKSASLDEAIGFVGEASYLVNMNPKKVTWRNAREVGSMGDLLNFLNRVFVRVSTGRVTPQVEKDTIVMIGVSLQ